MTKYPPSHYKLYERNIKKVLRKLVNQKIVSATLWDKVDCGITLTLEDGSTLSMGYSSLEGRTVFNNEDIDE